MSCLWDGAGSSKLELLSPACISEAYCRGMFSFWFSKLLFQCALPEQFWF